MSNPHLPLLTLHPSVSLFYLLGLFDLWGGLRTLLVSSIGAYLIATKIEGPFMPWIGFVFLMSHMSISHLIRQARADPNVIDITGKYTLVPRDWLYGMIGLIPFTSRRADGSGHEGKNGRDHQKMVQEV